MGITTKNTGGPAQHMTLRDHFAGQAMAALISGILSSNEESFFSVEANDHKCAADVAYAIADAMLQERDK